MCHRPQKFVFCLPLWTTLIPACLLSFCEAVLSIAVLKSPSICFTYFILIIMYFLQVCGNRASLICYRKSLFFTYIIVGIAQLPIIALHIVDLPEFHHIRQESDLQIWASAGVAGFVSLKIYIAIAFYGLMIETI